MDDVMNRSFLIVLVPAIAVGLGYVLLFRWKGLALEPLRFVGAGIVVLAAVILVRRHQKRKATPRGR